MNRVALHPWRSPLASTVAAVALVCGAGGARADPPVWRAAGAHAQVEMFGSIHLLSNATQWKTPALDKDIAAVTQLWFEIPLGADAQQAAVQMMRTKGLLPPGQSLSDLLPAPLAARVAALAARDGLDPAALNRLKPWLAELELTVIFYTRQGYSEALGVESQVNAAAPATVRRDAFETLTDQVDLFADEPVSEQVASLKETLDEIDADPGIFARAADAWRRGDVKALVADVVDPMRKDDAGLYERVLVDRNRRFATRIEQMLRSGEGRILVVVGVGHLVGPDGVPALLRRDGFKVEGP